MEHGLFRQLRDYSEAAGGQLTLQLLRMGQRLRAPELALQPAEQRA